MDSSGRSIKLGERETRSFTNRILARATMDKQAFAESDSTVEFTPQFRYPFVAVLPSTEHTDLDL
jgi:hypothetical protein